MSHDLSFPALLNISTLHANHISQLSSTSSLIHTRRKHTVPALLGNKDEVFSKYGVPGFLSASTYQSTWQTYQTHLCNTLNQQVLGTTHESLPVRELHEALSKRPADAALYNIAAQAHHNHFFWNTLSSLPQPSPQHGASNPT